MQLKSLSVAALVLATLGTPIAVAAAADTAADTAVAVAEPVQHKSRQKERRICRREPTTGTRLAAPRVCMTKSQWDAEETRARDDMNTMQLRQRVAIPGMGGTKRGCDALGC